VGRDKTLIQSFYNFLEDTEGLTDEDLVINRLSLEKRHSKKIPRFRCPVCHGFHTATKRAYVQYRKGCL
jgi:hypothetical protein